MDQTLMAPLLDPRDKYLPSLENFIWVISNTEQISAAGMPVPISYIKIVFRAKSLSLAPK